MSGDPLQRLAKFSLAHPWTAWQIARGGLDGYCATCRGKGFVVRSPCTNRERGGLGAAQRRDALPVLCTREGGCEDCRSRCGTCRGTRLARPDALHAEDFGDAASRAVAQRLLGPGVEVDPRPRIDRHPPALG